MDTLIMKKIICLTLTLTLVNACSRPPEVDDRSEEYAPGKELAGTYALQPSYVNESIDITAEGKVRYHRADAAAREGLAYKNRFRLIIFLDNETEPTGIFMLNDRSPERWPGFWKGEVRFIHLKAN